MNILPRGLTEEALRAPHEWQEGERYRFPLRRSRDCLYMWGGETWCRRSMGEVAPWTGTVWQRVFGDWWVALSNRTSKTALCTECRAARQKERWRSPKRNRKPLPPYLAVWPQAERIHTHGTRQG